MLQQDIFILQTESIKDALKKLNDKLGEKVLLVVDNEKRLLGTITDGDMRRFILSGKDLGSSIVGGYTRSPVFIKEKGYSKEKAKDVLKKNKVELLPIIDEENKVIDFNTWDQLFPDTEILPLIKTEIKIPVVIMAGGKGTRLEPFTKILPKPLIPLGDKPVVEIIIDDFRKNGVNKFYLTIDYKGEMIESYFNNIEKDYEIIYIRDRDSTGTAGSLKLLEKEISDIFIVSNCDVMVKADFSEVLDFHTENNSSLTIFSAIRHYKIPYGVTKFKNGGEVTDIIEKPEYTFTINTGMYVMSKEALQFIPEKSVFDMPDLIKALIDNNKKVITYPVNESDYIDIGQWEEYKNTIEHFNKYGRI